MNKKEEGCRFFTLKDEFDTWGDFLLEESVDAGIFGDISMMAAIMPRNKTLFYNMGFDPASRNKDWELPIKYCPMCGRLL